MQRAWVGSLVGDLKSNMQHGMAKRKDDHQSWPCCFCNRPLPLSIKALACCLSVVRSLPLDRSLPSLPVAGFQNKENFPFHQPCLFIGFRVASSQIPLYVTVMLIWMSILFSLLLENWQPPHPVDGNVISSVTCAKTWASANSALLIQLKI